ncbi:unnamed protein product, partial [Ectocarpus sp. 8 AP-2014]
LPSPVYRQLHRTFASCLFPPPPYTKQENKTISNAKGGSSPLTHKKDTPLRLSVVFCLQRVVFTVTVCIYFYKKKKKRLVKNQKIPQHGGAPRESQSPSPRHLCKKTTQHSTSTTV